MADGSQLRVTRLSGYPESLVAAVREAALTMFDPEISESLGLSLCQVRNIRKKNDIPARIPPDRWTPDRDAQLIALYIEQGLSAKDTGKALGVSEAAVRARAKGLDVRRDPSLRNAKPPPPPKRAKPMPVLAPVPRASRQAFQAIPDCEPVAFLAREPSQCRWPIDGDDHQCCGQKIASNHPSYCDFHKRVESEGWASVCATAEAA